MAGYTILRNMKSGIASALLAALLFGASTPMAKILLGDVSPVMLAGLLYAGSGLGLAVLLLFRSRSGTQRAQIFRLRRSDIGWLAAATAFGGVLAPVLLMLGLSHVAASQASLLLNLEGVFTALLAWFAFRENFDRRIALGMGAIVVGGVVLVWGPTLGAGLSTGALLVVGACICWALDNNLTRRVAAQDAQLLACTKGLVAGAVNLSIAASLALPAPSIRLALLAGAVGFLGYGVSLSLFVVGLRLLGTARTAAYFSLAPFCGALFALLLNGESLTPMIIGAGALMAFGLWLHLTERHEHEHEHQPLEHEHSHSHDIHHAHEHQGPWDGVEPHTHRHVHVKLRHRHRHFPDIHHQHRH